MVYKMDFIYNTNIVSQKQYNEHLKLYSGYVEKTNQITDELAKGTDRDTANAVYSFYRGLKESETFAIDGIILHEEYFKTLGKGGTCPGPVFNAFAKEYFGSFENWKIDFIACAKSARGWCVCSFEQRTRGMRNLMFDAHNLGPVVMAYPIVVLDMYEHAYFIDYGTDKAAYINKFLENMDWNYVERQVSKLAK